MTNSSVPTDKPVPGNPDETQQDGEASPRLPNETANDFTTTIPILTLTEDAVDSAETSDCNPYDTAAVPSKSKDSFKK